MATQKFFVIATLIVTSQILRMFLESSLSDATNIGDVILVERTLPGVSETTLSGNYVVRPFYKSEGFPINGVTPYDVTLVLHGTVDKMYKLIEIADVWDGPVSMSILAPGSDAAFVDDAIDGVRLCWKSLRRITSFHLVFPAASPPNVTSIGSFVYLSCKDVIRRLRIRKPRGEITPYPHNVMRNAARRGTLTNFVLHVDADVVPIKGFRNRFLDFLKRNALLDGPRSSRDLYVLPVFEIRHTTEPVRTKRDLLTALEDKNARTFMQETCPQCHQATDYERWLRSISYSPGDEMRLSDPVKYTRGWEPFFIAPRHSPLYDEKFTSYGQDRLSHMCELQAQGYSFKVLNDEFLVYDGYRSRARASDKEIKRRDNRKLFYSTFVANLRRFGYTDEKYHVC